VDEEADSAAVEEGGFAQVENEMKVSGPNQPTDLGVENFGTFGAVDVADYMDHLKFAEIPDLMLH
jgi:hypothetical protein